MPTKAIPLVTPPRNMSLLHQHRESSEHYNNSAALCKRSLGLFSW